MKQSKLRDFFFLFEKWVFWLNKRNGILRNETHPNHPEILQSRSENVYGWMKCWKTSFWWFFRVLLLFVYDPRLLCVIERKRWYIKCTICLLSQNVCVLLCVLVPWITWEYLRKTFDRFCHTWVLIEKILWKISSGAHHKLRHL